MAKPVQQSPTTWRLRVSAGSDPVTRKRKYVTRTVEAKNERDAQKQQNRLQQEVDDGRHTGTEMTFGQLLDRYIEHGRWSGAVKRDYASIVEKYLRPALGGRKLYKLGAWDLDSLYDSLQATTGAARINRVHSVVSGALGQAVRWRWIPVNPARDASPPAVPKAKIRRPSVDDVKKLLAHIETVDPDFHVLVRLDADSGGRRGELLALRWCNVDLEAGTITVEWAIDPLDNKTLKRPKSDASVRTIALHAATIGILKQHRERLAASAPVEGDAFVFPRARDYTLPWRPDVAGHRFKEMREEAGVDDVTLHRLRHYVATEMIAAGVDIVTVAGRLGHARPSVTADVYSGWKPAKDREAANVLGRLLQAGD